MPIPMGNNNLGSYDSYHERVVYDSVSFMGYRFGKEQIDIRSLNLFGKVDTKGNQILLPRKKYMEQQGLLSPIDNSGENFMLSVFAEPFIKLRERFSYLFNRSAITGDSSFVGLEPKRSLLFWEEEYSEHIRQLSDSFYEYFNNHPDRDQVGGFLSFVDLFSKFVTEACPYTVFTLKNYMVSRFCDPLSSGMMIEVATGDASDDTSKHIDFISDPNYAKFVEEAAYYGFIVDKHIPWRLVVNPNSEYIKNSLSKHGFSSLQEAFSGLYIDPTMVSFEMFLNMLEKLYETILLKSPQYLVNDYSTGAASTSIKCREKVDFENPKKIMTKMGDLLTIRLYTFLRARERNLNLSQSQFDSIAKKALSFKKQVDIGSAIVYIDRQTSGGSTSDAKPDFRI